MKENKEAVVVMRKALSLAKKGLGRTSPNPAVGCLILGRGGVIAGSGYHKKAGGDHAEIEAIKKAGRNARGKTLFVTLEPCCHHGRTPPCTDAIIEAGIKRVVVGAKDPNPRVSGRGIRRLKRAGIEVLSGVLAKECTAINEAYNKYIRTGSPLVTLKLAATFDGRIATSTGDSKWITDAEARRLVHRMRSKHDAVMVGSGTVLADDPELTVREVRGRNPRRVVIDSKLSVPLSSRLFVAHRGDKGGVFVITTAGAPKKKLAAVKKLGVEVISVPRTKEGLSLKRALRELGKREITSVLVEGGGRLAAGALKAGVVDKVALFYSPKILGGDAVPMVDALSIIGIKNALHLADYSVRHVGGDLLVEGYLERA